MKSKDVRIGETYVVRVSGELTQVRITGENPYGGWDGVNKETGRSVRIRSPQRLRGVHRKYFVCGHPMPACRADAALILAHLPCPQCRAQAVARQCGLLPSERLGVPPTCPDVDLKIEALKPVHGEPAGPHSEEESAMSKKSGKKASTRKAHTKVVAEEAVPAPTAAEAVPAETAVAAEAKPKTRKKAVRADGTLSGLDAAAQVLAEAGQPLNAKAILERILAKGLWRTGGKTPEATLYSAMLREMQKKGEQSRFAKAAERGKFISAA